MIPEQLELYKREFRRVIARREYNELLMCVADMRRVADDHIAALATEDPRRRQTIAWLLATIDWGRLMVATQRQGIADELDRLPKVGHYLNSSGNQDSGFCFEL